MLECGYFLRKCLAIGIFLHLIEAGQHQKGNIILFHLLREALVVEIPRAPVDITSDDLDLFVLDADHILRDGHVFLVAHQDQVEAPPGQLDAVLLIVPDIGNQSPTSLPIFLSELFISKSCVYLQGFPEMLDSTNAGFHGCVQAYHHGEADETSAILGGIKGYFRDLVADLAPE